MESEKRSPPVGSSPQAGSAGASDGAVSGRARCRRIFPTTGGWEMNAGNTIGVEHFAQLNASAKRTRMSDQEIEKKLQIIR